MKYYGPYIRKDGRKVMAILKDNGKHSSISYARYLMQQHLGRILESWEQVDHINNDPSDDRIENLQILTLKENAQKYHALHPREYYKFICPNCGKEASKYLRDVKGNHKKGKSGPYCSKQCAGQYTYKNPWEKK